MCDPVFGVAPFGDAVAGCGGRRVSMIGLEQMGKAEFKLAAFRLVPVPAIRLSTKRSITSTDDTSTRPGEDPMSRSD
jgi:hypothetical protein